MRFVKKDVEHLEEGAVELPINPKFENPFSQMNNQMEVTICKDIATHGNMRVFLEGKEVSKNDLIGMQIIDVLFETNSVQMILRR